jgi:hypothetical protein
MLLVADHSFLVTQRWDIRVGMSQGPRTLITLKCLDTSILNTDENHLISLTPPIAGKNTMHGIEAKERRDLHLSWTVTGNTRSTSKQLAAHNTRTED